MSKVFVNVGLSLDGYMAPEGMTLEHWDQPEYKNWAAKWGALMGWIFTLKSFRETHQFGEGGETGPLNDFLIRTTGRIGANIMGKRMFEGGERGWPEEAPFHTDVFVLTHERREPWVRPGGTTFYVVNDGIESALAQARAEARDRDIRISGGADVIQQYLNAGVVDELEIGLVPVLFGGGRRLFEGLGDGVPGYKIDSVLDASLVTFLRYVRA